jgi:hypothetical protein
VNDYKRISLDELSAEVALRDWSAMVAANDASSVNQSRTVADVMPELQ